MNGQPHIRLLTEKRITPLLDYCEGDEAAAAHNVQANVQNIACSGAGSQLLLCVKKLGVFTAQHPTTRYVPIPPTSTYSKKNLFCTNKEILQSCLARSVARRRPAAAGISDRQSVKMALFLPDAIPHMLVGRTGDSARVLDSVHFCCARACQPAPEITGKG
jgi:hypothetical protein